MSKQYDISQIISILKATPIQLPAQTFPIQHIIVDSRNVVFPRESIFFALKGKRLDGHDYVESLYNAGIRCFVVSKKIDVKYFPEATFLWVQDVQDALQKLVIFHRKQFSFPIIGITGSNGKTIVKEWLFQTLQDTYHIVRNPKSYNSQIGVPLSVWKIDESHNLGIFEAGISEPAEMEKLEPIIKPTIGVFTNIGEAHSEGFINARHKIREKLNLFKEVETLIYCADYGDLNKEIISVQNQFKSNNSNVFNTLSWAQHADADIRVTYSSVGVKTIIELSKKTKKYTFSIPYSDKAYVENATHCIVLMLYLKLDEKTIAQNLEKISPVAMRLELKEGVNNSYIINDSYNSDFNSLKIALDFLNQQAHHAERCIILSDILQSGRNELDLYTDIAKLIKQTGIQKMYGIGNAIKQHQLCFKKEEIAIELFDSTDDFIKKIDVDGFKNQYILLKGARKFKFERISKLLEKKAHETVLEINLNAIAHNLNVYHSMLKPSTKIMVMIKAFAYGSGSYEIAKLLQHQRVDYLAVAYTDEGVELRKAGIDLPIMVLNPEVSAFDAMFRYKLEPEIYSLSILEKFMEAIKEYGVDDIGVYPIHLKLDTGMHRLGFEKKDIPTLVDILKQTEKIKVASIFSHLAASDEDAHKAFTLKQIQLFEEMASSIKKALNYAPFCHILNSAGISKYKEYQMDMVRLGIGLYGYDSGNTVQDLLENVGTLKTTISQIKEVEAGETVGYSRKGTIDKTKKIATVSIGYADGFNRKFSNGVGKMIVKNTTVSVIGNVCMDMCMLDVTDVENVQEGDEVIVFGKQRPVWVLANELQTIPYEVLTAISQRVKRIFFQE